MAAVKTIPNPSDPAVGREQKIRCAGGQGSAIATGTVCALLAERAMRVRGMRVKILVCGSSGQTVVTLFQNGVSLGTVTIDNAATDPTVSQLAIADTAVAPDDIIEARVTTAPTGGSGLAVDVMLVADLS